MKDYQFMIDMEKETEMHNHDCEWCGENRHEDFLRFGIINTSEELGWICNNCDEETSKGYNDYYGIKGDLQLDIEKDK